VYRHFVDVVDEVEDGLEQPAPRGWKLAHRRRVDPAQVAAAALAPELTQRFALGLIRDDDEVPVLAVARGRSLLGQGEALLEDFSLDRTRQVEPAANAARGREQLVQGQVEDRLRSEGMAER
jgi:hypothetical protein